MPVKDLPPLDHDSIMNIAKPTPSSSSSSPSPSTSINPATTPSPTEKVTEGFVDENKNTDYSKYYAMAILIGTIAALILVYILYKKKIVTLSYSPI
jgi:hypothetical protein